MNEELSVPEPTPRAKGAVTRVLARVSPRWWQLLVLVGVTALVYFRAPVVFLDPHLYAEESTIYFAFAYEHGVYESLVTPHLGYYSLLVNVATTLAAHAVPLEHAPYVTLAAACAVLALLATLVMMWGSPFPGPGWQALALFLLVLIPPGYGRLHTTFSHFYLCVATALVLTSVPGGRFNDWVRRAVLVVAGLTGVVSVFLTPLFWWKWWRGREREVLVQALILAACTAVQAAVYLTTDSGDELWHDTRFGSIGLALLPAVVFNQSLVHLFLGRPAMQDVGASLREVIGGEGGATYWLVTVGLFVGSLALFASMLGPRAREGRARAAYLFVAYGIVLLLSVLAGTTGRDGTRLAFIDGHQRYFYAPNVFVALALVVQLVRCCARWKRWTYGVLVTWLLVIGVLVYHHQTPDVFTRGPSWRAQVARWRENPRAPLFVWPERRWPPLQLAPRE